MAKYYNGLWWPDLEDHLLPYGRAYQHEVRAEALKLTPNRRTCVDVGAHVGIASLDFAESFDLVLAFEPVPPTFECLVLNTRHLPNVSPVRLALSDRDGKVEILENAVNTGNSVPSFFLEDYPSGAAVVETKPLDAYHLDSVDLIKIDVEGFEAFVLLGAEETIKRCKPTIILEVKGIGALEEDPQRPLRILGEWGYYLYKRVGNDYICCVPVLAEVPHTLEETRL